MAGDDDIEYGCKCKNILNGEVAELAEGARLRSVCRFTPTEGSNPSLSATNYPRDKKLSLSLISKVCLGLKNSCLVVLG